jgi:hypothetical protein
MVHFLEEESMDFEKLLKKVDSNDGVHTTTMLALRDAYGKGRLGPHVCNGISKALAGLGLGHYPPRLPEHQDERVRLYRLGSAVGDLIEAALDVSPNQNEVLRRAASGNDADVLRQIKELVCS